MIFIQFNTDGSASLNLNQSVTVLCKTPGGEQKTICRTENRAIGVRGRGV